MDVVTSFLAPRHLVTALLALCAIGCASTGFIGTTATSFMNRARTSKDPNERYLAYQKLASPRCYDNDQQKVEAAKLLAEKLKAGNEPLASRAAICRTLGELRRPEGHEVLVAALDSESSMIRAEAARALGKLGIADDATHLTRIMTADQETACKIAAIEGLGELKSANPQLELLLVKEMENDDPSIRMEAVRSLRKITKKDLGTDPDVWRKDIEPRAQMADTGQVPTRR